MQSSTEKAMTDQCPYCGENEPSGNSGGLERLRLAEAVIAKLPKCGRCKTGIGIAQWHSFEGLHSLICFDCLPVEKERLSQYQNWAAGAEYPYECHDGITYLSHVPALKRYLAAVDNEFERLNPEFVAWCAEGEPLKW